MGLTHAHPNYTHVHSFLPHSLCGEKYTLSSIRYEELFNLVALFRGSPHAQIKLKGKVESLVIFIT